MPEEDTPVLEDIVTRTNDFSLMKALRERILEVQDLLKSPNLGKLAKAELNLERQLCQQEYKRLRGKYLRVVVDNT